MTRIVFVTTLSLLLVRFCPGQSHVEHKRLVAQADRYAEEEQYHLALDLYEKALGFEIHDPAIDYRMAETYRRTFNYSNAEVYYLKTLYTAGSQFPRALYYHALMLKLNGNLSEAETRFDEFIRLNENNVEVRDFVEQAIIDRAGCSIAQQDSDVPTGVDFVLAPGAINTIYNDFAPAMRTGTIVITSTRITSNRALIDERHGQAFSDNYYFDRERAGWENKARRFSIANSIYHDGSGSFTRSGNVYYFTVCEEECRIYETHVAGGRWTKSSPVTEVNMPGSESRHPGVSPGGDTLFFASDRPGGYGGFDIWMSTRRAQGAWSPPVNAGRTINTKANEVAPAFTNLRNALFFSSDGHAGYGGYDLFVAKSSSAGDTVIYNLNRPFNSVRDDCFLSFGEKEIWWSSNRSGGKGGFDIYSAQNIDALDLLSKLTRKNRNDSRMITLTSRTARAENLHLLASRNEETIDYNNLTYERKAIVNRMVANRISGVENRHEDFPELTAEEFQILYQISHARFQGILLKEKYASTLLMEVRPGPDIKGVLSVTGRVIDASSGASLRFSRILLTNEYGDILKMTNTNEEGHFRFTDVPAGTPLFLRLENSSGKSVNAFVTNLETNAWQPESTNYVENVYFDFDQSAIRPEATQVLKELAHYLKLNPTSQVEIYAFADDRGSDAYNFDLTQKRGEAIVAFLKGLGVDETSLAIIPKGKQRVHITGDEVQRQYNRRAEFYINGEKNGLTSAAKTYVLKREADWSLISRLTGVAEDELKALNGARSQKVKAFQPIRVPINSHPISDELFLVGI